MLTMFDYVFRQVLWMIGVTVQLIAAMGIGVKWVYMTIRCVTFAMLDMIYFMPHVFWYMLSPNIIRRVAYRSSEKTKMRNLKLICARRGVRAQNGPTQQRESSGCGAMEDAEGGSAANKDALPSLNSPIRFSGFSGTFRRNQSVDSNPDLSSTVELYGSTLNPADGSVMRGLPATKDARSCAPGDPRNTGADPDSPLFNSSVSFQGVVAAWRRKQEKRARSSARRTMSPQESLVFPPQQASEMDFSMLEDESDSHTTSDEDEEDVQNLHNRATLDIYLPVPLDYLYRFMTQEKTRHKGRAKLERKKFPIIISVNGGAWIVGCYLWNFLIARILAARGYVVFCPDYRNFPQTTMEGMTLDVSDAIAWVLANAERYNGDIENVTLMGQSAGAHLTMMSLISQAQQCAYKANGNGKDGTPAPSDVAYNVPRYNPRKSIHRYVGLSGMYNVQGAVKHFDGRGLYRSVLYQIAGGKANLPRYSINCYFDEMNRATTGETLPGNIFDFLPQCMFFLHGDADKSAPVTESANLVYVMRNAQRDHLVKAYRESPDYAKTGPEPVTIEYILIPGATHTDSIIEEPLASGNSHIAEFLSFYNVKDEKPSHGNGSGGSSTGVAGSPLMAKSEWAHNPPSLQVNGEIANASSEGLRASGVAVAEEDHTYPALPVNRPDGVLLPPIAQNQRSRLIRLAGLVNPF